MTMTEAAVTDGFAEALRATGPLRGQADRMTLYDPLIGDWEAEVVDYDADGSRRTSRGEWHFAWVLEGRAVQDVWIVPPRSHRRPEETPQAGNRYGTTLRVFDPTTGEWRATWFNPVTGVANKLIGRRRGDDIVHEGQDTDGTLIRWVFSEITPQSFHWTGEESADGGKTWRLAAEFFGRRAGAHRP